MIDREPREFTEDEAIVLSEMAAMVVDALELRLAARRAVEHELALRDQASCCHRSSPRCPAPGSRRSTEPADAGLVGGDFYDAFELADGSFVLVVGDVSGKGATAATVTALARHTVRTASLSTASPAEMLGTLNRAMFIDRREIEIEHFCTALIVSGAQRAAGGLTPSVAARSSGRVPRDVGGGSRPATRSSCSRTASPRRAPRPGWSAPRDWSVPSPRAPAPQASPARSEG